MKLAFHPAVLTFRNPMNQSLHDELANQQTDDYILLNFTSSLAFNEKL